MKALPFMRAHATGNPPTLTQVTALALVASVRERTPAGDPVGILERDVGLAPERLRGHETGEDGLGQGEAGR